MVEMLARINSRLEQGGREREIEMEREGKTCQGERSALDGRGEKWVTTVEKRRGKKETRGGGVVGQETCRPVRHSAMVLDGLRLATASMRKTNTDHGCAHSADRARVPE